MHINVHREFVRACVCVSLHIANPLSAHRVRGWLGLSEMQAQAYLIWIMYKTLIEAVCLHQSRKQEDETEAGEKTKGGGERERERDTERVSRYM